MRPLPDIPLNNQYERISAYYNGLAPETALHHDDYKVMKRWEFAHDLLMDRRTRAAVINQLTLKYTISKRTAHSDIEAAQQLFAFKGTDREVAKGFLEQWGIDLYNKCLAARDFKAAQGQFRNLMKLHGLDRPDSEHVPPEALTPHITVTYKPGDVKEKHKGDLKVMIRRLLEGNLDEDETEDVDYEEQRT